MIFLPYFKYGRKIITLSFSLEDFLIKFETKTYAGEYICEIISPVGQVQKKVSFE